ncbi:hypothetical protein SDC9_182132 [bioreactor metagenome]|uniref:ABC transporter Uup C-terminal domain-containing protein n=1 Tax=bioreactor metagenome TaxID=1076179 RepID=A0A645H6M8_9ZZZZ
MDFLQRKKLEHLKDLETRDKEIRDGFAEAKSKEVISFQEQKEIEKEQRKKRNAIERCEKAIEETENKIKKLELSLSQPKDSVTLESELKVYNSLKTVLEQQMEEWENLQN